MKVRITCVRCEQGRFGPVSATKVRTSDGWGNRCSKCGAVYPAPPPWLAQRRRRQRQIRRREAYLESHGQQRLFPP